MERKAIRIYSIESSIQAEMIPDALGGNQIPAHEKDVGSSGITNVYGISSLSGEETYVTEEDAEQTLETLGGMGL